MIDLHVSGSFVFADIVLLSVGESGRGRGGVKQE